MSERLQVYKCESCGDIVQVIHASGCDPACCGKPMKLLAENTTDAAKEKHVPVIERSSKGIKVSVGSVAHPMESDHYIEWIELILRGADGAQAASWRAFLKPGDKPEAFFPLAAEGAVVREYCNKHGLWKA
jgi:superoxide reductase